MFGAFFVFVFKPNTHKYIDWHLWPYSGWAFKLLDISCHTWLGQKKSLTGQLTYWPVVQRMLLHLKIVQKCSIYICSHPHRTQYARRLRVMTRVKKFERLDFGIRGYLEQRHHWSQLLLKRHRHYQPQQQSTRLLLSQIFCIIHHVVGQSSHWSNFFDEIYKLLHTSAAQKYCISCRNKK